MRRCKAKLPKLTQVRSHGNNVRDVIIVHMQTHKDTDAENAM